MIAEIPREPIDIEPRHYWSLINNVGPPASTRSRCARHAARASAAPTHANQTSSPANVWPALRPSTEISLAARGRLPTRLLTLLTVGRKMVPVGLRSPFVARVFLLLAAVFLTACAATPPTPTRLAAGQALSPTEPAQAVRPRATAAISPTEPAQAGPTSSPATATPRPAEPTATSTPIRAPTTTNTPESTPTNVAAPALAFAAAPTSTPKPLAPTPTWTPRPPATATAPPPATSTPRPPPTATPIPPPAAPNVIIQYIRFDGVVPKTESDEYAVVFNAGASAVNLQGWRLNAGDPGQDFVFPALTLAPGQACWVYTNEVHPETCGLSFRRSQAIWNNKGDCGRLYRADGQLAHEKCY